MKKVTAGEARRFLLEYLAPRLCELGLKVEDVADDYDLLERGVVDSVGIMEMISAVEEHFDILVDFEGLDVNDLTIIGPFCRYIEATTARGCES